MELKMKSAVKVAVASRSFSKNPALRAELSARYINVTFNETGRSLSGQDLVDFLSGHERAITALEKIDESLLRKLPGLKVISKYGVGLDMIDLQAMSRFGVLLGWSAGVNKRSVAELTLGFALALVRGVPMARHELLSGRWVQPVGRELTGKIVGIIGCGNVGQELVRFLAPFQCTVLACDIRDYPDFYRQLGVHPVPLDRLLAESDIVSLHVPLDASTRGMMSRDRLTQMKSGGLLINTSRGDIVDEIALKELLKGGHLSGAAFDVFGVEPPTDSELMALPTFLGTPHIGGSSVEAVLAMGRSAIENLDRAKSSLEFQ
jgi:D-3-phosphoglycerate dehydrogenase